MSTNTKGVDSQRKDRLEGSGVVNGCGGDDGEDNEVV